MIFDTSAGVESLHEVMTACLMDVHGGKHCLLKAVKADLAAPELVAGCRAILGRPSPFSTSSCCQDEICAAFLVY